MGTIGECGRDQPQGLPRLRIQQNKQLEMERMGRHSAGHIANIDDLDIQVTRWH